MDATHLTHSPNGGSRLSPIQIRHLLARHWVPPGYSLPHVETTQTALRLRDDLQATLSWRLSVDGSAVLGCISANHQNDIPETDRIIVPLFERGCDVDFYSVEVRAGSEIFQLRPVATESMSPTQLKELGRYLCIELSASQIRANPLVSATVATPISFDGAGQEGSVDFKPVAAYYARVPGLGRDAKALSVYMPEEVECDHVIFDTQLESFDERVKAQVSAASWAAENDGWGLALRPLTNALNDVLIPLDALLDNKAICSHLEKQVLACLRSRQGDMRDWLKEFVQDELVKLSPTEQGDYYRAAEKSFRAVMDRPALRVQMFAPRDVDGSLEIDDLAVRCLAISGVAFSFSDAYIHVQRRPAKLLGVLGAAQLFIAYRLL